MNPAAILALIGDLYSQVAAMTEENQRLTAERDEALKVAREATDAGRAAVDQMRPTI